MTKRVWRAKAGWFAALVGVALWCATLPSCIEEKCDPGFKALRGACYPVHIDAGLLEPPTPAPADEDAGESTAAACAPGEGFGVTCEAEADCTCGTRCIPVLKICSLLNCQSDPEVCPPDWQCRDISDVSPDPAVKSICLAKP